MADTEPPDSPGNAAGNAAAVRERKRVLRARLSAARRARPADERDDAARELALRALELPELAGAAAVAAYVSVGGEPGTGPLLEALRARGTRVLLPVLLPDDDLDWAAYEGPGALAPGPKGLREPTAARLGRDAVRAACAVLLPGLAVGADGVRLGRGGGSYDRVLARLGAGTARVVLLYPEEVLREVPAEAHDAGVDAAVTPEGVRRFGPTA